MYKEREINLEEEKLNTLKNYFDKKEQILTVYIYLVLMGLFMKINWVILILEYYFRVIYH